MTSRVRVLHLVSGATKTGPADPALEIAAAQRRILGWDARIAWDTVREGDMSRRAAELEVPAEPRLFLCAKGGVFRALSDVKTLRALAPSFEVIHAHASHDHGLAALARRRGGGPALIRSIHHPRSATRRPFQIVAHRRTDAFTVVAEAHRTLLLHAFPEIDPPAVTVVPGAVDPDRFRPGLDGARIRAELGIPAPAPVIGMIARFQAGRRQVELIRAFAKVERTLNAGAFLALIGKGETQAEIEAAIAEEKIGDRVRLYGFRDADLPEAIASLDATVLLKEGSDAGCRAVLQSLACGVPVIGARVPAITEALEGSGAGWLIDPVDLEALEGALREAILRGPEQRSTMATAARSKVLAAYTERARVERIAEIVRAVTSPRAEPR